MNNHEKHFIYLLFITYNCVIIFLSLLKLKFTTFYLLSSSHTGILRKERKIMNEISRLEKDSILYYQGGGENISLSPNQQHLREFYNVDNSYIVINALLMPGISNEKARLKEEKRKVSLSVFKYMDELVKVYCRMYSAMCKYTCFYEHEYRYHTYRNDRMNTLDFLTHGQMYSFLSTKNRLSNDNDFHDKDGILLLEIEARGNIEHIDVNAVLGNDSKYPLEQEILFAPFTLLDQEVLEMTEDEKLYRDIHGNPPEAKYLLHLRLSSIVPCETDDREEIKTLYQDVMNPDSLSAVRQVWERLMDGTEPDAETVQRYTAWKERFQIYLRLRFAQIKYETMAHSCNADRRCEANRSEDNGAIQKFQLRLHKLETDLRNYSAYTDGKRTKYKHYVQTVNVIVSVLYPLTTFFIALSIFDQLQEVMKAASLLSSLTGTIAALVAKGSAWNEKLQQRTSTFIKLDKLTRDMEYEKSMDENSLDRYVQRFKTIVDEDNKMGLENALIMGNHSESLTEQ